MTVSMEGNEARQICQNHVANYFLEEMQGDHGTEDLLGHDGIIWEWMTRKVDAA
jgi:hypothetical protein